MPMSKLAPLHFVAILLLATIAQAASKPKYLQLDDVDYQAILTATASH